jgi:hypothetical protein
MVDDMSAYRLLIGYLLRPHMSRHAAFCRMGGGLELERMIELSLSLLYGLE